MKTFEQHIESAISHLGPFEFDRIHEINSLCQNRQVQAAQETADRLAAMDPLGHPGYADLLKNQVLGVYAVASAMSEFVLERLKELKIEVPPELARLHSASPYIAGKVDEIAAKKSAK